MRCFDLIARSLGMYQVNSIYKGPAGSWGDLLNRMNLSGAVCIAIAIMAILLSTILMLNLHYGIPRKTQFTRFSALLYLVMFLFACTTMLERYLNGRPGQTARVIFVLRKPHARRGWFGSA